MNKLSKDKKRFPKKSEEVAHYESIILEDIRSKMELVIEVSQSTRQYLDTKIDDLETRLTQKIDDVTAGLAAVSREVFDSKQGLGAINSRLCHLETRFDGLENRFNGLEGRFDKLETKVDKMNEDLSEKIDKIGIRLDGHEVNIELLKKNQGLMAH